MLLINAYMVLRKDVILTCHSYWLMAEKNHKGWRKIKSLGLRSKLVRDISKAQNTSFVKPDIPIS